MTRTDILKRASGIVGGERVNEYGEPEDNFRIIARLWSAYLGIDISSVDVSMLMVLFKAARVKTGIGTDDSFVDIAGYAACGGEISSAEKELDLELHDISERHKAVIENFAKSIDIPIADRDAFERIVSVASSEIAKFGIARRSLMRQLAGLPSTVEDNHYGWTTMTGAELITREGKYWLRLPAAEKIGSAENNN